MAGSKISFPSPMVPRTRYFFVILLIKASIIVLCTQPVEAFLPTSRCATSGTILMSANFQSDDCSPRCNGSNSQWEEPENQQRRSILKAVLATTSAAGAGAIASFGEALPAMAEESIFAPKFVQEYPDFQQTNEGWSYKDVKVGNGDSPKTGDRVVYEWSGYTIGYFGRPFEAKG